MIDGAHTVESEFDNSERIEKLSSVSPNTLMRNLPGGEPGIWFRQNRGVVSPGGWLPDVWGDPDMVIIEDVRYEPSREAEIWRQDNPGQVAVLGALRNYQGDSYPMRKEHMIRTIDERGRVELERALGYNPRRHHYMRFATDLQAHKQLVADVRVQIPLMQTEGLIAERQDAIGLSIHAREERRLHLTARGMAEAIRRGVGFENEFLGKESEEDQIPKPGFMARIARIFE